MKRDYTSQLHSELLSKVHEVESEQSYSITDWIDGRFNGLYDLVAELSIDTSLKRVKDYHNLVIDKNSAAANSINDVYEAVYSVDRCFVARFAACETRLDNYRQIIEQLAQYIDPSSNASENDLSAAFKRYESQDKALSEIATSSDGLTEETISGLESDHKREMLEHIISFIVDRLPGFDGDAKMEMPIGLGLTLYYEVESEMEGESGVELGPEITYGIEEGKSRLKECGLAGVYKMASEDERREVKFKRDGNGKWSIEAKNDGVVTQLGSDGVAEGIEWKRSNTKYTYKNGYEIKDMKSYAEVSAEVETAHGSVTSTVGIKKGDEDRRVWCPVPVPAPAESSATVSIPRIDTEAFKATAEFATAVVVVGVIAKIAGTALAPFTGGGSLAAWLIP